MQSVFGLAAGVLSVLAFAPYVIDTIRGRTQPLRVSWLVWSVLAAIAFVSQLARGADASLWFAGSQTVATIVIFALSIRFGTGTYLRGQDGYILGAAALGLIAWAMTSEPAYALLLSIGVNLLGGIATVQKAFDAPETETFSTWVLGLIAALCAIGAVGRLDWVLLAYPVYLATLYVAIIGAMLLRHLVNRVAARVPPSQPRAIVTLSEGPTHVTDFVTAQDALVLVWDDALLTAPPPVTLRPIQPLAEACSEVEVLLGSDVVAQGPPQLGLGDIRLLPESSLSQMVSVA